MILNQPFKNYSWSTLIYNNSEPIIHSQICSEHSDAKIVSFRQTNQQQIYFFDTCFKIIVLSNV